MRPFPMTALLLTGVLIASAGPLIAQQTSDSAQQTPAATSVSPAMTSPPLADTVPSASTTAPTKVSEPASAPGAAVNGDAQSKKAIRVSKDYIKKLRNIGYYPKNDKGQLVFCKKEAPLGTRFDREICMDGEQLAMILERNQAQRDQLHRAPCIGVRDCQH